MYNSKLTRVIAEMASNCKKQKRKREVVTLVTVSEEVVEVTEEVVETPQVRACSLML